MIEEENKNSSPANINTELAKQRSHEASERTMMAWVRTALSLIGFGVGVYEVAEETGGTNTFKNSKLIGLALIILGSVSMILAIRENKINHKRLLEPVFKYEEKTPLGVYIGYALLVIGILASINIIYRLLK
jgi:putative membrane protein